MEKDYIVLVVDDDSQVLDIVVRVLKTSNLNFEVLSAKNLIEARKVVENTEISILIIDYKLPDGNGIDFVNSIKEKNARTPIIMLSGHADEIKLDALKSGVNMFLAKPFNGQELLSVTNNLINLLETYQNLEDAQTIIEALSKAIDTRDSYTEGHSSRVAEYSLMLYDEIGLNDFEERKAIEIGCFLHDIGKIGTPDSILKSKTGLSAEEYEEVKKHPLHGYNICKDIKNLRMSLDVVKHHHEKLDGSGYPDGLKGDEIPFIVQIVTIADIYDALTSRRAYRTHNETSHAFEIMDKEAASGKINNVLYETFKSIIYSKNKEII